MENEISDLRLKLKESMSKNSELLNVNNMLD